MTKYLKLPKCILDLKKKSDESIIHYACLCFPLDWPSLRSSVFLHYLIRAYRPAHRRNCRFLRIMTNLLNRIVNPPFLGWFLDVFPSIHGNIGDGSLLGLPHYKGFVHVGWENHCETSGEYSCCFGKSAQWPSGPSRAHSLSAQPKLQMSWWPSWIMWAFAHLQMENADMVSSAWVLTWLAQDGRSLVMAELRPLEVRKRVRSWDTLGQHGLVNKVINVRTSRRKHADLRWPNPPKKSKLTVW